MDRFPMTRLTRAGSRRTSTLARIDRHGYDQSLAVTLNKALAVIRSMIWKPRELESGNYGGPSRARWRCSALHGAGT